MAKKKKIKKLSSGIQFKSSPDDDDFLQEVMRSLPVHIKDEEEWTEPVEHVHKKEKQYKRHPTRQAPDDTLDLHGKTREEAIMMVQNFVMTAYHQRFRTLLIITGKGKHSGKEGPILNQVVKNWLQKNGTRYIKNFGPAPGEYGGAGALWIDLQ